MTPLIIGLDNWVLGIIVSLVGFVIPCLITREHPRKWRKEAKIFSGIFFISGIIIIIVTK